MNISNNNWVNIEYQSSIAHIRFHTQKANSLTTDMLKQLTTSITTVGHQSSIKVIVLESHGDKAFCSGASFDELLALTNETNALNFFSGFAHLINAIRLSSSIVIGKIHANCIGGGVGLLAATDYAIAVDHIQVRLSELAVGLGAYVIAPAIERKIGLAGFSELSLNAAEGRSALWAKEKGLLFETVATVADLNHRIEVLANQLSTYSKLSLTTMKEYLWKGTDHWNTLLIDNAKISSSLVLSDYCKKYLTDFKAKQNKK
ncbi:MAG: enoyl-CoA hydratase/isomerase family protein [Phycisphaerales bacterium]|nr:enoyl-CoA hydratase/isomerase family protein [Phycisphaerales bacterium]